MLCRACVFNSGGSGDATLFMAAKLGNVSMVEELLQAGHDPNEKKDLTTWTPVHTAANYKRAQCLRILLEHLSTGLAEQPDLVPKVSLSAI